MKRLPLALSVVEALDDLGPLTATPTRWSPRKVRCRPLSGTQRLYAVKYLRDKVSAAALISEIVGIGILNLLNVRTLEPALVTISDTLVTQLTDSAGGEDRIQVGLHFGTRLRLDFYPAQMERSPQMTFERFADPLELIPLWVADCWMMNLDRGVVGNILLEASGDVWHLVASDQSDCFLGAASLADGSFVERSRRTGAATYSHETFTPRALAESGGLGRLEKALDSVQKSVASLDIILGRVPERWWEVSGVQPEAIQSVLAERAGRMKEIVNYEQWKRLGDILSGGQLLGG